MYSQDHLYFLRAEGEISTIIRTYNWSSHPLGEPGTWPTALKNAVALLLTSNFPMFLWWGEERFHFYNDAFRASLGNNSDHPSIW